jgi:mannose-6-phosphate isomerase-like protein (cupin superfamily)
MQPMIRHGNSGSEVLTSERCWILELVNAPDDSAVSIARARVEPGLTTQLHCLRGVDERYLIVAGEGIARIGKLEPKRVGAGDLLVIPAGTSQQVTNDGAADLVFYCICSPHFTPDCYESLE